VERGLEILQGLHSQTRGLREPWKEFQDQLCAIKKMYPESFPVGGAIPEYILYLKTYLFPDCKLIPWMKYFWKKKNKRMTGRSTNNDPAIK
jgi:hypothetical protein